MKRLSFTQVVSELENIAESKGSDYGDGVDALADFVSSKEFGIDPWLNTILRINQKMNRLKSFTRKGDLKNESVDDSLKDIAVYAIHALRLYREQYGTETD